MTDKLKKLLIEERRLGEKEWQILCPAHNDTNPSLSVSYDENSGKYLLYCHSGCSYGDILNALDLKEKDLYTKKKVVKEYIYQDEQGKDCYKKVRYQPKSFSIKVKQKGRWTSGKFKEIDHYLYRLPAILNNPDTPILLVESEKSVERLEQEGYLATTSGGAQSWEPHFKEWLKGRTVYIIPDNDKAGRGFAHEVTQDLLGVAEVVYIVELPYKKPKDDIVDFLKDWDIDEFIKRLDRVEPYRPKQPLKLSQIRGIISKRLIEVATGERSGGFMTGYERLDRATGGLAPGNLWILAARPSVGKTAMALNFIINNPKANILFFSLEMNDIDIVQRMIAYHTGFSLTKIRNGQLSENGDLKKLIKAQSKLDKYNCLIEDTPNLSVADIEKRVYGMSGLDLIIIDYLGIMKINSENRNNALGEITSGLRALSKKMSCPMLVLSQLSRQCEYRTPPTPTLADLRDSGNIEQDADGVMFLYRARNEDGILRNSTDLIIAKNRQGACYKVKFLFDYKRMFFMPKG